LSGDPRILSDNESPSLKSGRLLRWVGGLVILTSIGLCIGFDVYREFYVQGPARLNELYGRWDRLIRSGAAPGRGVFLKFINFPRKSAGFTTNIYFRAVYVLYPQPVVVAKPEVVVNKPLELLAGNYFPDERWLRDRGVGSIVVVDFDPVREQPFIAGIKWLGN
jgi:hypothetical protein